jgi:predicted nucleotidyltransferase
VNDLLKEKREEILRLAEKHGARNVRVFGSVVRGEEGPQSDVDLLVTMGEERSYFDLVRLMDALAELLSRDVDIITDDGLSPLLRDRILAEATPI